MTDYAEWIKSIEYIRKNNKITAYIFVNVPSRAIAILNGKEVLPISNIKEPFDYCFHKFEFDADELEKAGRYTVGLSKVLRRAYAGNVEFKITLTDEIVFSGSEVLRYEDIYKRSDRNLSFKAVDEKDSRDGWEWRIELYQTADGLPVRFHLFTADAKYVKILAGTPDAEPVFRDGVIQTVMQEANAKEQKGEKIICATNADFFDIFGNGMPSGLCISGGQIVANADTERPFFGMNKNGEPFIGTPDETDINCIVEAVGGGQILVRDGEVDDVDVLNPFGESPHPRTAFGLTKDNKILVCVVDGRNPEWSNGATLYELAVYMISKGAVTAINADGGGSSTFIVRKDDGLKMLNKPRGLNSPTDEKIRRLFDSMLIALK